MIMNTAEKLNYKARLIDLLGELVDPASLPVAARDLQVSGVKMDSRQVEPGDLFLACFGNNHDARNYIDATIASGAVAVLAESGGQWQGVRQIGKVPVIAVDNLARHLSEISGRFYGDPSASLSVIGITGTNGKTSCSQFIAQAYG